MKGDAEKRSRPAAPSLLLRPRAEDTKLLGRANGLFGGYHLGANQSAGLTDLVRGYGKPVLVDPQTHIFSVPPSRHYDAESGRLRRTSDQLSQAYGEPYCTTVGSRRLGVDDFADETVAMASVTRVLTYQRNKSLGQLGLPLDPYYSKYRLWDEDVGGAGLLPQVLVPPYFYVRGAEDPWLHVNLSAAEMAEAMKRGQERVYPVLLFAESLLDDPAELSGIADVYLRLKCDGYLLWPNRFDEARQSPDRLRALAALVSRLADSGRPVSKLYGGYWSVLLGSRGLAGVSCGLGYWSSRNAFSYGGRGGSPQKNFYIPDLHVSVPFEDAYKMVEAEPRLRCKCPVCVAAYGGRMERFSEMRASGKCEAHFLYARRQEMERLEAGDEKEARRELTATRERLRSSPVSTAYFDAWLSALAS